MFCIIYMEFRYHFEVIFIYFDSFYCRYGALGHPGVPRRFRSRFWLHLGHPLGALGALFGEPFRSLWPLRVPKKRKKRRIRECLFANPVFDRIFFTFRVPWTPENINSDWDEYAKKHFQPRPNKHDFGTILEWFRDTFGTMLGTFRSKKEPESFTKA